MFDYETFQGFSGNDPLATARPFHQQGMWDYPPVILHTPDGIRFYQHELPHIRYVVLEGHQRHRYLRALIALDKVQPEAKHDIFIIRMV